MKQSVYMECRESEMKNGKIVEHNKFYQLSDNGDGTLTAWFGKIGTEGRKIIKPISEWDVLVQKRKIHGYHVLMLDINSEIQIKQIKKIDILLGLKNIPNNYRAAIITIKFGLIGRNLLSKDDMIYLNMVYKKFKEI
jgi:hypothetical protein